MGTTFDALNATSSLSQRRQATFNLELPPPTALQFNPVISHHKFPPLAGINTSHHGIPPPVSVGQLLTPPSNSASESSAGSSAIPTGTTPNSAAVPVLPYTPTLLGSGNTPNGYHTGYTPPSWHHGSLMARSMFSPSVSTTLRHSTNSPSAGETSALPPPPYDMHMQSYGAPLQLTSPTSVTHAQTQHNIIPPLQHGVRPSSQHSPMTPGDVSRPGSTPTLYTNMSNTGLPHPSYHYSNSTPVSQSPHPHSLSAPRVSPTLHQGQGPPQPPFLRPPPPSYSLPGMPGPIMSNVHSPGAQMTMMGNMQANMLPMGFNSGYVANPPPMYGHQRTNTPQQAPTHERPFKCDQCPQSFNRNHDLKRHKRIHLAVKPFPCGHCDKSFSRKDALKRHILVKGCGTGNPDDAAVGDGVKSESGSDGITDSPSAAPAA